MHSDQFSRNSSSIHDSALLCQQYLKLIYQDAHQQVALGNSSKNNIAETYGEILGHGITKLLDSRPLTRDDLFYDLGSGLGKIVLQVFLQTEINRAVGIEIVPELHEYSLKAAQRAQSDLPEFFNSARQLKFLCGSFLELPMTDATVVLTGSPCFSPTLLSAIAGRIDDTPSIHTLFSLRPMLDLQRLRFKKTVRVECSWDAALCYVYQV